MTSSIRHGAEIALLSTLLSNHFAAHTDLLRSGVWLGVMVELTVGLEPTTACLQDRCATNCATPAKAAAVG